MRGIDERTGVLTGAGLDAASPESVYEQWDIVPPEYAHEMQPNVLVRNWQSIPLEARRDDWIADEPEDEAGRFVPASVLATLRRRRLASDPTVPIRKLLHGCRDVVVINDEAHHVYGEKRTRTADDLAYIRWSKIIRHDRKYDDDRAGRRTLRDTLVRIRFAEARRHPLRVADRGLLSL
ncbi:MAG: hypothetical protein ACRDWD_01020 [Acidimicrobiia bacterium]